MNLVRVKTLLLWLFGWQMAARPVAAPIHFLFSRSVRVEGSAQAGSGRFGSGQACAVLDGRVFSHAAPSLRDLRLFGGPPRGASEIPYAVTVSEPQQQESENARILNLGLRSSHIVFDLEMPRRPYTGVVLDLAARDFIATAVVSGSDGAGGRGTALGRFTLFDLTSQHLARSTSIPLAESRFRYLHVDLALTPAAGGVSSADSLRDPGVVRSASVPPSREAQTVYVTSASANALAGDAPTRMLADQPIEDRTGRTDELKGELKETAGQTVATFRVPLRVPVERIAFVLKPGSKGEFSRSVAISAQGERSGGGAALADEEVAGKIFRVHRSEGGEELAAEALSIPVAIGSNMQQPAVVRVAVENGQDAPLPIAAVELQMRRRSICFDAGAAALPVTLYYGDPAIEAPVYEYASRFRAEAEPRAAELGPEGLNPEFRPRPESQTLTERHPDVLWVAFLGAVCVLAMVAIRAAKRKMGRR